MKHLLVTAVWFAICCCRPAGLPAENPREGLKMEEQRSGTWTPGLTAAEQETIFAIARDTLQWCARGQSRKFDMAPYRITPKLKTILATFVTLKISGELRCQLANFVGIEKLQHHKTYGNFSCHQFFP